LEGWFLQCNMWCWRRFFDIIKHLRCWWPIPWPIVYYKWHYCSCCSHHHQQILSRS
jgi:hypothetical protein